MADQYYMDQGKCSVEQYFWLFMNKSVDDKYLWIYPFWWKIWEYICFDEKFMNISVLMNNLWIHLFWWKLYFFNLTCFANYTIIFYKRMKYMGIYMNHQNVKNWPPLKKFILANNCLQYKIIGWLWTSPYRLHICNFNRLIRVM